MASPFGKLNLMPDKAYNVAAALRQIFWTGRRLHSAVKATKAAQAASLVGTGAHSHNLLMDAREAFQEVILAGRADRRGPGAAQAPADAA